VFTTIVRRIFKTLVFFFAAYAFVFMPLGEKTALEHILAIVRTPQAQRAGSELKTGAERLVKKLKEKADGADEAGDEPRVPRRRADRADRAEPGAQRPLMGSVPTAPSAAAAIER
jgi:hypothetical protein